MAWKPTGSPIVRKQRDKWVVRVDGVDTATGKHKPKQLGTSIQLSMLDRDDVAGWIEALAAGGKLSKRSVQICRTVLRAALTEAVDEGLISGAGGPRRVASNGRESCS